MPSARSLTIYYDPEDLDLKEELSALRVLDPIYSGRSYSEIARMLLISAIRERKKLHDIAESEQLG